MRTLTLLAICAAIVLGVFFFADREGSDTGPSLFGIPLVPPIFAQSSNLLSLDPQAGLSSYIQRDPSLIDFAKITPLLSSTIDGGENYLLGAINIPQIERSGIFQNAIPVRVYIDTNGIIIVYLTKEKISANIFRWYESDPPGATVQTVLGDALAKITTALEAPVPTDASWYHWNYPSATHFSAATRRGVGNMYMRIPAGATFSENPSYSWHSIRLAGFGNTTGTLLLETPDGAQTVLESANASTYFTTRPLPSIIPGQRYAFVIQNGSGGNALNHFLGVAVIYQIP